MSSIFLYFYDGYLVFGVIFNDIRMLPGKLKRYEEKVPDLLKDSNTTTAL